MDGSHAAVLGEITYVFDGIVDLFTLFAWSDAGGAFGVALC